MFQSQLRGIMHDSPSRNKVRMNTEVRAPAPAAKTNPVSAATTGILRFSPRPLFAR